MSARGCRAFSLIEILIVIAIVLAIAAVAFPSLWGTRDSVIWSQSVASIESAASTARAEAMRRGVAITLGVVEPAGSQELWMWPFSPDTDEAGGELAAAPAWRERIFVLPTGVRLRAVEELEGLAGEGELGGGASGGLGAADASVDQSVFGPVAAAAEPTPWIVFVPSGEAWVVTPYGLAGSGDRRARFAVSAWSGRVRVTQATVGDTGEVLESDGDGDADDTARPDAPDALPAPAETDPIETGPIGSGEIE